MVSFPVKQTQISLAPGPKDFLNSRAPNRTIRVTLNLDTWKITASRSFEVRRTQTDVIFCEESEFEAKNGPKPLEISKK